MPFLTSAGAAVTIAGMFVAAWASAKIWFVAMLVPLLAVWPATAGLVFVHAHDGHPPHVHPPVVALAAGAVHHGHDHAVDVSSAEDGVGHSHGHGEHSHSHGHSHPHEEDDHHLADADVVVVAKLTQPALVAQPLLPCGSILPPRAFEVSEQVERPEVVGAGWARSTTGSRVAGILRAGHALLL